MSGYEYEIIEADSPRELSEKVKAFCANGHWTKGGHKVHVIIGGGALGSPISSRVVYSQTVEAFPRAGKAAAVEPLNETAAVVTYA